MSEKPDIFIQNVHRLLQAGYETLTTKELRFLRGRHEPDISGVLAMRIQQLVDDKKVEGINRAWTIADNHPENETHLPIDKMLLGKKRKLPDLKLRFGGARAARYFRFEAKCLSDSGAYKDLISHKDGLGRFLRRVYARGDSVGGLLGYVKTETAETHAQRVKADMCGDPIRFHLNEAKGWKAVALKGGPVCCFRTVHARDDNGGDITMFHTFLLFQ